MSSGPGDVSLHSSSALSNFSSVSGTLYESLLSILIVIFSFSDAYFLLFEIACIILIGACFRKLGRKFVGYSAFCSYSLSVAFYY
jgi:hypothetical protein